ncbi:uncharacterized protein LOC144337766 [Macaca mulatta]
MLSAPSPARNTARRVLARALETCDAPWLLARRARRAPQAPGPRWSRLGRLGKFPSPRRSGQGRSGSSESAGGKGGRPELPPAGSRSLGAQSLGPGSRERAQLQSLCLAQRSGRPVPRRPLRAQLPLSMPGAGRCPERVPPAQGFCSPPRPTGPGSPRSPGRRRREPTRESERANQPASQPRSGRPTSPASSARLRALPALLPARRGRRALKGPACSQCADPGGDRGRCPSQRLLTSRGPSGDAPTQHTIKGEAGLGTLGAKTRNKQTSQEIQKTPEED